MMKRGVRHVQSHHRYSVTTTDVSDNNVVVVVVVVVEVVASLLAQAEASMPVFRNHFTIN